MAFAQENQVLNQIDCYWTGPCDYNYCENTKVDIRINKEHYNIMPFLALEVK